MRVFGFAISLLFLTANTMSVFGDENATGGQTLNAETVVLGGPFNHAAAARSTENSTASATFLGGFSATHVRFSGSYSEIISATVGAEADILMDSPPIPPALNGLSFVWQNPSTGATFDFDTARSIEGTFGVGFDPAGTWDLEFIDTFDDGPGTDAVSSDLSMTFEEQIPVVDVNGVFSMGTLNAGTSSRRGEFAIGGLFDSYTVTLPSDGTLSLETLAVTGGFTGVNPDTEIAIFDATGTLVANDDDGGTGVFSGLFDLPLTAGDYTLVVCTFNSTFANGFAVTPGGGIGDYGMEVTFVPSFVLGDANGDGLVNNGDIEAFVLALLDPAGYAMAFPSIDPNVVLDFNSSGTFDNEDINGFLGALGL